MAAASSSLVVDFQAGGGNPHYGRISHWLAAGVTRRLPNVVFNIKVGQPYLDLDAVGSGLAQVGVTTPCGAARQCYQGQGLFSQARPQLRGIGVVPHRDALVLAVARDLGISSIEEFRERRAPLRLSVPPIEHMTGHAGRHLMAAHGITPELLEGWGGRWMVTESAQAAWRMVAEEKADAMLNESIPQSFRPLAKARPIRLLSFDPEAVRRVEEQFGYAGKVVPAGNVRGQEEPVLGLNWEHWIVVAHANLLDEIAYALADVFLKDTHAIERQYTADNLAPEDCSLEAPMRPEVVSNEVTVALHPGAERRYREAGALKNRD